MLVALGVFQLWLWGTRIANLLGETGSFSAAFVAVHLALYGAAIGAGVLLVVLGGRHLAEVRSAASPADRARTDGTTPSDLDHADAAPQQAPGGRP